MLTVLEQRTIFRVKYYAIELSTCHVNDLAIQEVVTAGHHSDLSACFPIEKEHNEKSRRFAYFGRGKAGLHRVEPAHVC